MDISVYYSRPFYMRRFPTQCHGYLLRTQARISDHQLAQPPRSQPPTMSDVIQKQTFEIYQATEKALIAQVAESIDPIYFKALLNRITTRQYSSSILAVILHLFITYSNITLQKVKGKITEFYNMHYDTSQPVDSIFDVIEDLAELAEHANSPMTEHQMIDLA